MEKTQTPVVGSVVLLLLAAAAGTVFLRAGKSDAEFCRTVLNGLAQGKPSVTKRIDWDRLQALQVDVGATYRKLPNDGERAKYRAAFIANFANGFHRSGASVDAFRRWRVQERTADRIVIAVDYEAKRKTLLMTIPSSGRKKLESLQWQ